MIASVMLVTTCPECKTTFRLSVGILEKAGGQVRCGRCAGVFDANIDLREVEDPISTTQISTEFRFDLSPEPDPAPEPEFGSELAPAPALASEPEAVPAAESDRASGPDAEAAGLDWLLPVDEETRRHGRAWAAGVAVLTLWLTGQFIHHYRNTLAELPAIGPALAAIYSGFGAGISANIDLDQYDLLDLTAVAEPSGEDQGWLVIETRVHNTGPKAQPTPHIFVRLLDRWEDTIAGRYFGPEEYAVTEVGDLALMGAGSTIDAQFIIVDPGPSATGFELELCVKRADGFDCESGDVFE